MGVHFSHGHETLNPNFWYLHAAVGHEW
jgi:hypothetical protein